MVLPAPGGPTRSALCPPAAAISKARLQLPCPRTSDRSSMVSADACVAAGDGGTESSPENTWAASARVRTACTSRSSTSAPSGPFSSGTMMRPTPILRASSAMGSTPRTGSTSPERDSSPMTSAGTAAGATRLEACSSVSAMARSKPAPSLRTSPGARFTVTRLCGSSQPAFRTAVATRTLASMQAASGNPTRKNPGKPRARSTWTDTGTAVAPSSAAQWSEACTRPCLCEPRAARAQRGAGLADPSENERGSRNGTGPACYHQPRDPHQ